MTTLLLIVALGLFFAYGFRMMAMLDRFLTSGKCADCRPAKRMPRLRPSLARPAGLSFLLVNIFHR